ncbi:tetratricopeptide repeat protein [Neisseria sp. 27098_8_139]
MQWFGKAAEQGLANAQYNLGVAYANGQGVHQDLVQAEQWYRKAAEQGFAEAQYNLGVMYAKGEGVRQNYKIANEWFGKACNNGLQQGCDVYRVFNQAGY